MGAYPPHRRISLAQGYRRLGCHFAPSRNRPQVDGTAVAPAREGLRDELLAVALGSAIVDGVLATLESPVVLSQYWLDASGNLAAIRAPVLALYAGSD